MRMPSITYSATLHIPIGSTANTQRPEELVKESQCIIHIKGVGAAYVYVTIITVMPNRHINRQ